MLYSKNSNASMARGRVQGRTTGETQLAKLLRSSKYIQPNPTRHNPKTQTKSRRCNAKQPCWPRRNGISVARITRLHQKQSHGKPRSHQRVKQRTSPEA